MKARFLSLVLLCLVLLCALWGCKEKDTATTNPPPPATTTTTTPPPPTKTVSAWLWESLSMGYAYRFQVASAQGEVSFLAYAKDGQLILARSTGDGWLYYAEDGRRQEAHLFGDGLAYGLRFTDEGAAELQGAVADWLDHVLPKLNLTDSADLRADISHFGFTNTQTDATVVLLPTGDGYAINSIEAKDSLTRHTVTITREEDFLPPDAPNTETLLNESSLLLGKLLLLESGFVGVAGEGDVRIAGDGDYTLTLDQSERSPALAGGKTRISATLTAKDGSKTLKLFYGEIDGEAVLRLGDIKLSMPADELETVIEELLSSLMEGKENGGLLNPEFSNNPTSLANALPTPEVSNNPTSPDGVYFDEEGNLHFSISIPEAGAVSGVLMPTEEGLSLSLVDCTVTVEDTAVQFSLEFTFTHKHEKGEDVTVHAPVEVELDAAQALADAFEKLGEYGYYQAEGQLTLSMTLPIVGKVQMDDITYTLLTDKEVAALSLRIKYPSMMNGNLLFSPDTPALAVVLSTVCESTLYIDGENVYIQTDVSTKYMAGITLGNATKTVSVKLSKRDALQHMETVISHMLNIDMSQSFSPLPVKSSSTTPTVYVSAGDVDRFALSLKAGDIEGKYLVECDIDGLRQLAERWDMGLDIPEELNGATASVTLSTDETGVCQGTVRLTMSNGMTVTLLASLTYPEALDAPILPEGLAEDPAYAWLTFDTETPEA